LSCGPQYNIRVVLGLLFLQGLTNIRAEVGTRKLIISNTDGLLLYI